MKLHRYNNFLYLNESDRCTNVTLRAFGICINEPIMTGQGVIEYLTNNGFEVKVHDFDYFEYSKKPLKKFIQDQDMISIPDLMDELKSLNNIIITGGAEKECLKEVEVALDALGKKYTKMDEFVY